MIRLQITTTLLAAVIGITSVGSEACLSESARREQMARRRLMEGDRKSSVGQRAAAARPKPWQQEKPALAADRTGVEPYRADKQAEAAAPRVKDPPAIQRCLRLIESYPCPLLAHRWTVKSISGGVKLEVEASRKKADRLRAALRCRAAKVYRDQRDAGCLARFSGAEIRGGYRRPIMWLELTTLEVAAVSALRKKVRDLVAKSL